LRCVRNTFVSIYRPPPRNFFYKRCLETASASLWIDGRERGLKSLRPKTHHRATDRCCAIAAKESDMWKFIGIAVAIMLLVGAFVVIGVTAMIV
jgi:hypothetical protein